MLEQALHVFDLVAERFRVGSRVFGFVFFVSRVGRSECFAWLAERVLEISIPYDAHDSTVEHEQKHAREQIEYDERDEQIAQLPALSRADEADVDDFALLFVVGRDVFGRYYDWYGGDRANDPNNDHRDPEAFVGEDALGFEWGGYGERALD